jgi:hypothetical protein
VQTIRLYHRTSDKASLEIVRTGFRDWDARGIPGVYLSNYPVDCNEGAKGPVLFEVNLRLNRRQLFEKYELIEIGKPYREFIIPSAILNDAEYCSFRLLNGDEEDSIDIETCWNDYPVGQPSGIIYELYGDQMDAIDEEIMLKKNDIDSSPK